MFEYFQHIDCIFASIELARAQISGEKSRWCYNNIIIIEYTYNYDNCCSKIVKIAKIIE